MSQLSRRAVLEGAGLAALAAAVPLNALAQGAPSPASEAPLWNLTDIYPSDAAWVSERQAESEGRNCSKAWRSLTHAASEG